MVTREEFDALTNRVSRLEYVCRSQLHKCGEEVDDLVEHDDPMGTGCMDYKYRRDEISGLDDAGEETLPDGTNP